MSNSMPMQFVQRAHQNALLNRDANARYCTLATLEASDPSQVRMRTLVLRNITDQGCLLFVNRNAQKNLLDLANAKVEVLLFYPTLMAQFRLRGVLSSLPEETLASHWQRKPYEAKLLDHFYATYQAQSSVLPERAVLEKGIAELMLKYPDPENVPFIHDALGLYVTTNYLEVWQGLDNGIHQRHLYTLSSNVWHQNELVP